MTNIAGKDSINDGGTLDYVSPNTIAFFTGNVNSYSQVLNHNHNPGASASSDFIVSNDASTDTATYGDFGINSSGWATTTSPFNTANATYLISANSDLVLGTVTANPIRFGVGSGVTDLIHITGSGIAVSVNSNLDVRSGRSLRLFNVGNSAFSAIQAGSVASPYTMILPTALPATGSSIMVSDSSGNMAFVGAGSGISFSTAATNTPIIRTKRPLNMQFSAGYTPLAAGPDNVVLTIPDSAVDGTSPVTFSLKDFYIRVETPSAGSSRIQLEKSTGTGAFTLAATGSSYISGFGLTISGAGIYVTQTSSFAGTLITSGDNLRLNWTLLNATHANFSVQLLLEEV